MKQTVMEALIGSVLSLDQPEKTEKEEKHSFDDNEALRYSSDFSITSDCDIKSPDEMLAFYGPRNAYMLFVWLLAGCSWSICTLSMMISAFLTVAPGVDAKNSYNETGSVVDELYTIGRKQLADYAAPAYLIGVTVGSPILTSYSDKVGRRLIAILSTFMLGAFGLASAMAPEIYSFVFMRFLQGCFFTGCLATNWVLAYESVAPQLRSYTPLVFGLFWVAGYCVVAPLAYFLVDWRIQLSAASAPAVLLAIGYYFFIPESFHFSVSNMRLLEIERFVERLNKCSSPNRRLKVQRAHVILRAHYLDNGKGEQQDESLLHQLASNPQLRLSLFIVIYIWTCDTFVYYGQSLISTQLAGNLYVNFVLVGFVEVPSYIASPFLLERMGRRGFIMTCHIVAACSFFAVTLFDSPSAHLAMWMLGKFAIACVCNTSYVYASELFPTALRTSCIGVCSAVSRGGGALAPFVQNLAIVWPTAPTLTFGGFAAVAVGLAALLPEAANRKLHELPELPSRKCSLIVQCDEQTIIPN